MPYTHIADTHRIQYTDKYSGQPKVKHFYGSDGEARGWMNNIAREHGSRTDLYKVTDFGKTETHLASESRG